jgi:hypothetical protein
MDLRKSVMRDWAMPACITLVPVLLRIPCHHPQTPLFLLQSDQNVLPIPFAWVWDWPLLDHWLEPAEISSFDLP